MTARQDKEYADLVARPLGLTMVAHALLDYVQLPGVEELRRIQCALSWLDDYVALRYLDRADAHLRPWLLRYARAIEAEVTGRRPRFLELAQQAHAAFTASHDIGRAGADPAVLLPWARIELCLARAHGSLRQSVEAVKVARACRDRLPRTHLFSPLHEMAEDVAYHYRAEPTR